MDGVGLGKTGLDLGLHERALDLSDFTGALFILQYSVQSYPAF